MPDADVPCRAYVPVAISLPPSVAMLPRLMAKACLRCARLARGKRQFSVRRLYRLLLRCDMPLRDAVYARCERERTLY